MKRLIYKSLTAIGLMSLAYYMANPQKYNRMAKKVSGTVSRKGSQVKEKIASAQS